MFTKPCSPIVWLAAALALCLGCVLAADEAEGDGEWVNPWRKANGELSERAKLTRGGETRFPFADDLGAADTLAAADVEFPFAYKPMGSGSVRLNPDAEYIRSGADGNRSMLDRGIDSADVKWRRQARTEGVRMRMLNGPEAAFGSNGYRSDSEWGLRNRIGAVAPLNSRWELAGLNDFNIYNLRETGGRAGLEALTLRLGANPSVSFRPWIAATPYTRLWDGNGSWVGLSAGLAKMWRSGIGLEGEAYAWRPWDEGYDTAVQDGRSHGLNGRWTIPVDRRLTFTGGIGHEWLELGDRAPGGYQYAGRRFSWDARVQWLLLKRDGAYMGYGFRDADLWSEELVPVEFGFFADVAYQRYYRPDGFTVLDPTEKSVRERVGIVYSQAVSPHLGFNAEAYIGQDLSRGIRFGELYGGTLRFNLVFSPSWRAWTGFGYESESARMEAGGGPDFNFSFGLHYNF